ncbi:unnamed protein product [Pelagomonas calceolata]|uniref:ADF-H domain-containing protein n=1 Tax=Pelagomonas calceolata TaxID=35677 RepID=A0A8J2WU34_9STRA|nr:unnamed protein product [Pelagomonas calceolata]|mmetsp:Transcript_25044/g.76253  ORF Transcript_25044/g.76253 Transcript_25044/m.76253 type:complete len:256 (+) Transcript_25044:938-1705(+)
MCRAPAALCAAPALLAKPACLPRLCSAALRADAALAQPKRTFRLTACSRRLRTNETQPATDPRRCHKRLPKNSTPSKRARGTMSQHVAKLEDGTENHLKTGGEQITYANKATAGSVDPRCKEVFTQLKIRRKHRYVVYKIDPETEAVVVETIGERDADLDALLRALPDADSRYAIFDHAYKTYDGRPANKLFFLSWFPSNATPYSKMAYTHAKEHVREVFTGVFDIMARTTDEARSLVTGEAESESDQEFDDDDF